MKVKLTKTARIAHAAGDIVEVSQANAHFLISTRQAVRIEDAAPEQTAEPKKKTKKK